MASSDEVQRRAGASVSNDAALSNGICALLAVRLGSMNFGLSLQHAANGCFKAMISVGPVPGVGPLGDCGRSTKDLPQTVLLQASRLLNKGANHGNNYRRYGQGAVE